MAAAGHDADISNCPAYSSVVESYWAGLVAWRPIPGVRGCVRVPALWQPVKWKVRTGVAVSVPVEDVEGGAVVLVESDRGTFRAG